MEITPEQFEKIKGSLTHLCTPGEPAKGLSPGSFCTACYTSVTGDYPTQRIDVQYILPARTYAWGGLHPLGQGYGRLHYF
jgi:hypothetical protein